MTWNRDQNEALAAQPCITSTAEREPFIVLDVKERDAICAEFKRAEAIEEAAKAVVSCIKLGNRGFYNIWHWVDRFDAALSAPTEEPKPETDIQMCQRLAAEVVGGSKTKPYPWCWRCPNCKSYEVSGRLLGDKSVCRCRKCDREGPEAEFMAQNPNAPPEEPCGTCGGTGMVHERFRGINGIPEHYATPCPTCGGKT